VFRKETWVPRLSAIVITLNEVANIAECLDSLAFCDERIVVDAESADDTVARAQAAGARVVMHPFSGFGAQKNFALSLATGDWVLSVDADERVSPALAAEITATIANADRDAYEMPRASSFCGRLMRHSGWSPDFVLRLFRRGGARFSDHLVHEQVVSRGKPGRLRNPLIHHPVTRLEQALSRVDRYSSASAAQFVAENRRVSFSTGILHGFWTFFQVYVLRAGFLDGREGFLLAVANAEGSYYRYMKTWLEQRRRG
jgi:glycosyltransferase involved in cell wall biosynthesis